MMPPSCGGCARRSQVQSGIQGQDQHRRARIQRDLDTIGLIGSQDTVVLTNQVVADFEILAPRMRRQARCGDAPMKDLNEELTGLRDRIWELRAQFRTDLAIPHE